MTKNKKICFVAHFAYGAMSGEISGHIGGVERQTSMMARWLASKGYEVSILTWDEGQPQSEVIDGVRIIKMCQQSEGFPGLRFFSPRWSGLISAMRMADADVYYQNCGEYVTGQVAIWCRLNGRQFIYSVASDPDCDPKLPTMNTLRERVLYRIGLQLSDKIIVQTNKQKKALQDGFGLGSTFLPMPCKMPKRMPLPYRDDQSNPRVVWVGRISKVKRLELLLEVARQLPDVMFDIVGGGDAEESYIDNLFAAARDLENVTLLGKLPGVQVAEVYQNAALLCCTSEYEGFPNTFLEAWSCGLPIISTVDPDGLLEKRELGLVAHDCKNLVSAVASLLGVHNRWKKISDNAVEYFDQYHDIDSIMPKFESVLGCKGEVSG